ncbi:Hermansky-Pudlak syndrome 3 isoform X2 [Labeo rohita]|uniref:Hermansky-Pudlak syndrome 3 isoform X2 n=1 Tax=Labeo rohita TaxID=84645 RepID=A0A498NNI7_LABRO|nr:Hermansky-Pudlak syndrome 3 isoform X2 [Labeo rohita]
MKQLYTVPLKRSYDDNMSRCQVGPYNTERLLAFLNDLHQRLVPEQDQEGENMRTFVITWDNVAFHHSQAITTWFEVHPRLNVPDTNPAVPEPTSVQDLPNCEPTKESLYSLYELQGVLGRGSFGTVYKAIRKTDGRQFAIKRLCKWNNTRSIQIHIVAAEQEPGLVCCSGGALFVVSAGGCKIEAYNLQQEGCPLICRFSSMGSVLSIRHSAVGDYLVTIEEKNKATYLRAYTNWRYQAAEKTRVGVRLLGHLLRGSSFRGTPKEQMEIIEIPLFEPPLCMACCSITGDLLVGCAKSLVVFSLKRQTLSEQLSVLDFERVLILHIQGWSPSQVAFCAGYVALQTDLEILVVKLTPRQKSSQAADEHALLPEDIMTETSLDEDAEMTKDGLSPLHEQEDFFLFPKHQEMLGNDAQECGISLVLEWTGMEADSRGDMSVVYVLFRRFAPDFFQGCSVEETHLHSLQLRPMFSGKQEEASISKRGEPTCMFVFFSLPNTGYMYSLKNTVELMSTYQYPEKAHQAVLSDQFLYVITRNALQCFTVRCSAVAARVDDPYIDTTMKACPPITMEVCALRIQLFIGLKILCQDGNHIVLLTAADVDSKEDTERPARKNTSRKTSVCKATEPADSGHGWNLYVISSVSTLQLYREIVEYSKRYEQSLSHSCIHLLSEGHLLLRTALLSLHDCDSAERAQLQEAFQESCAHLGDCFSRFDKKDCHLALPYYKMSGLSVTDVIKRNMSMSGISNGYGKGFIFFLKHSIYEETMEELSKDVADKVLDIFSVAEPAQLPHVVSSPSMLNADPDSAMTHLKQLEDSGAPSITLSLCTASLALRKGDLNSYRQQMDRHAEMLQVYGFIEEPKLLLHGRGKAVLPTILAQHLRDTQEGLLVAAVVALHENSKIRLEEADLFFQELCKDGVEVDSSPQLLVDFWEALLVASSHESIIQELLFRLTSVYIDRITRRDHSGIRALKTAEDLSLLCGPTLEVSSILPLLEQLSESDNTGLSVHVLCATKLGQHERSIVRLLDRCPQAIISYANNELQNDKLSLWWQKLFPEVCDRIRKTGNDTVLLSALKETLVVASKELNPLEFLDLLPDDGTAHFFLPHLLECSQ